MKTLLSLDNVTVRRNDKTLVDSLSWVIEPNEQWALLGANGSGKTLTLSIVQGRNWPTSGTVSVLGKKFGEYDLRKLRPLIGCVDFDTQYRFIVRKERVLDVVCSRFFSSIGLFDETPTDDQRQRAAASLQRVGIAHLSERLFHTLSFGEQKRTLIARALVTEPKLLILDEPCTGLDLRARDEFLVELSDLLLGFGTLSCIFVTHHVEEIMPCITHGLILRDGQSVARGPIDDVLQSSTLSSAFGLPLQIQRTSEGRYYSIPGQSVVN